MNESREHLTSGRTLSRNSILFFIGEIIPLFVGIFALPYIIRSFGVERYGILGLFWGAMGYLAMLDLGIGRSLTKEVSRLLATHQDSEILRTANVAIMALAVIGGTCAIPVFILSSWLVDDVFNIPASLHDESVWVFRLLALLLPLYILTVAMQAILAAYQRFDLITKARIPFGLLAYVVPLLTLPFTTNLIAVVTIIIVTRMIALLLFWKLCRNILPRGSTRTYDLRSLWGLIRTGGWLTLSNAMLSIMVYVDRFLIGIFSPLATVAFYVTPYELVTKLLLIPGAIVETLFPAFSAAAAQNSDKLAAIYNRSSNYAFLLLFPAAFTIAIFSDEGLRLWLGREFASEASPVLRWLVVGVFMYGVAHVPYALLQSTGHSKLIAKLYAVELPAYLCLCTLLIKMHGAEGAAIAWTLRAIVDGIFLLWFCGSTIASGRKVVLRLVVGALAVLASAILGAAITSVVVKLLILILSMGLYGFFAWKKLLGAEERNLVMLSWNPPRT